MDLEARRLALHARLMTILGSGNVYFQPPNNLKMVFPCIRYERAQGDSKFAGNRLYLYKQKYELTLILQDPDGSGFLEKLLEMPMTTHDRSFAADNLNHDVFTTYF